MTQLLQKRPGLFCLQLGRPTETIQIPAGQSTPLRLLTTTGGEVPVNRPWTEITTYPETGDFLVILWRSPEHNDWDRPLILAIPAPDGNPAPIHHGSLLVHSNERALVILYRSDGESPRRPAAVITRREPTTR